MRSYDAANFNDRLLLGLKGTMSEAELHILNSTFAIFGMLAAADGWGHLKATRSRSRLSRASR
ncbi:protein of unknown function (plasmid) [Rhodovastum atsumiense]|nr:protein of unknown function [Rhodovastum atsumiense]